MAVEYKMIGGDGREYGPATLEEIRQWCEEGRVAPGTLVWRSDEQRWLPASGRDELKWDLPSPQAPPPLVAPEAVATAAPVRPAGFWVRLAAHIFDALILGCLATLVTLPWAQELSQLYTAALEQGRSANPDMAIIVKYLLVNCAINLPLSFAYFVGFNGARGATPGKRLFGLQIRRQDGSPLGFALAFGRHAAEWLSFLTLGVGHLLIVTTPQKRALHDLLARTQVVFTR